MSLLSPVSPLQPGKPGGNLLRPGAEQRDPNAKMLEATKEEGMKMAGTAMEWLSARLPFSASKPKDIGDMGNMLVNMVDSSQPAVQATAAIRAGAGSRTGRASNSNPRNAPANPYVAINTEKRIADKILDQIKKHGKELQNVSTNPSGKNGKLTEEDLQKCNKIGDDVKVLMETLKFWYRTAGDSSMAIARNV